MFAFFDAKTMCRVTFATVFPGLTPLNMTPLQFSTIPYPMPIVRKKRKKKRSPLLFTATCAAGLEPLVEEEVRSFGGREVTVNAGAVSWQGHMGSAYRACLWSRFASRILYQLAAFDVPDTDILYERVGKILWDEHFDHKKTFAVYTTLVDAKISHSQYASLRVKDAIVDQFRKRFGKRPNIDTFSPDIRLNLHVNGVKATLSLDLSGDSLHMRGYRGRAGEAPLKETLAAGIVAYSGFVDQIDQDAYLLDPMCGSGTLLIEAALMLGKSAPGLLRKKFGFQAWNKHDHRLWERLIEEALEQEEHDTAKLPRIIGYDADPRVVAAARENVIAAGLRDVITIKQRQLADLHCPGNKGFIITNPPYGDRLSEKLAVKYLYRFFGERLRSEFPDWKLAFFTGNPDLADGMQVTWSNRQKLYNGPIKCSLLTGQYEFWERPEPARYQLSEELAESPAPDFTNRLRKNCLSLFPWAEKENVYCFRIYDRDIPEYNLVIDLYEQWVHVQEFAAPASVSEEIAAERFAHALQAIRDLLNVPHSRIFIKKRKKQKGHQQYQKKQAERQGKDKKEILHQVQEGACRFLVNFTDYLDTGLFLDHRQTRNLIREMAQGKTFLNLFGYTGSATVFAAHGGATATTTVDTSEKYLNRLMANLSLNGLGGPMHQVIEADCMEWLRREKSRYGLIFVDPPTFSNARHKDRTFDVQTDHEVLLELAMERLSRSGTLIFSTNFRKFSLSPALEERYSVEEITDQTLPPDFPGSPPAHRCWLFTHHQEEE